MLIAHIPGWAKKRAILEYLATGDNKLDAVVQCGTNMSLLEVTEKLEPVIGIPILGIITATFGMHCGKKDSQTRWSAADVC